MGTNNLIAVRLCHLGNYRDAMRYQPRVSLLLFLGQGSRESEPFGLASLNDLGADRTGPRNTMGQVA